MHRLPQLQLRLSELKRLRDEYEAKGGRRTMVHYIETLIAEAQAEMEKIEERGNRGG